MTAREKQAKFRSKVVEGAICGALILGGASPWIASAITAKANENSGKVIEAKNDSVTSETSALDCVDCGIYDVVSYWDTDEDGVYLVDVEIGNDIEEYYFNIPDIPCDISEVVLCWNGNQNDVCGYTFVTCR